MTTVEGARSEVEGVPERKVNVSEDLKSVLIRAGSLVFAKTHTLGDRNYIETADIFLALSVFKPFRDALSFFGVSSRKFADTAENYTKQIKEPEADRIPGTVRLSISKVSNRVKSLLDNSVALAGERPGSEITVEVADLVKVFIVQERHGILASRWIGIDVSSQEFWKRLNLD